MDLAVSSVKTLMQYVHTLRHLKPWQIGGRIVAGCKRKIGWTHLPSPPPRLENRLRPTVPFPAHDPWNTREDVRRGWFKFLNEAKDLGQPVDWVAGQMPLLWRFNLHYFHFLHLLRPSEQSALCRSWISANPPAKDVSWHPYPTSLRIVNWCRAGLQEADVLASLYLQAAYLFRNLETYVYGNHLLENARALVMAGRLFEDQGEASQWAEKGMQLYRQQTAVQILPDGGHFERSPMYHALVLEGYLDVLNVLPADHSDSAWIIETVQRMADALLSLTHPSGHLALFNDTTLEVAMPPLALQQYVSSLTNYEPGVLSELPEMGYFMHRDAELFLIIDGGKVGPDYLPAHAHADIFSYELSIGNQHIVIDSGVFDYQAGTMRRHVRSTKAHNTICVDGIDQVECWGTFRVARRFEPHNISFNRTVHKTVFSGTFSGYAQLIGDNIRHHRDLCVDSMSRTVTVRDRIDGRGSHFVENSLHFSPDVKISRHDDHIILQHRNSTCRIKVKCKRVRWEKSWYCPRFGIRLENDVLILGGESTLPHEISYTIHY